jgi:hypothetical protein
MTQQLDERQKRVSCVCMCEWAARVVSFSKVNFQVSFGNWTVRVGNKGLKFIGRCSLIIQPIWLLLLNPNWELAWLADATTRTREQRAGKGTHDNVIFCSNMIQPHVVAHLHTLSWHWRRWLTKAVHLSGSFLPSKESNSAATVFRSSSA